MDSSPISPAIDGDVCDEDIFSSPLNRDAAGFGDEDDDDSLVDDSSTVAGAIVEEDDIDEAANPGICNWNKFPPAPDDPKWRPNDFMDVPKVYYDKARGDMFGNAQDEIERLIGRLDEAEVRGDPKGVKKAIRIFLGPKSPIYHAHETIFPKEDYEHFARFMGAFFFSSSLNSTYSQCYDEPKINTDDFCDGKTYLSIWKKIEKEGLRTNGKRAWIKYEDALNQTLAERFSKIFHWSDKNARPSRSLKVEPYRDALVKALEERDSDDSFTDDDSTDDFDVQTAIAVLRSAFLKPQKKGVEEGEKSYTVKGQRAEQPVLKYFFEKRGKNDFGLKSMYVTGLNAKRYKNYNTIVRHSPDAAVINDDDYSAPVEVKNRVTAGTLQRQIESIKRIFKKSFDCDCWSMVRREGVYTATADCSKEEAHKQLTDLVQSDSELWQVLHHALAYSINGCYLVIGDGRYPIVAVRIIFPDELTRAYSRIIKYVTNNTPALNFLHGKWNDAGVFERVEFEDRIPDIPQSVLDALKSKQLKYAKLSEDSLKSFLGVWCGLKKELDHQLEHGPKEGKYDIKFPLPATARRIVLPASY